MCEDHRIPISSGCADASIPPATGVKLWQALFPTVYLRSHTSHAMAKPRGPGTTRCEFLRWAADVHVPVLGVEIWIATNPGPTIPTPFIYTFETKQIQGESKAQFDNRANREADEYIRSFEWDRQDKTHHGIDPFFNITFDAD